MATLAEQGAGPGVAPLVVAASRAVAGLCLITAAVPASGGLLLPGFVAVPAAAVPPGGMAVQLSASLRAVDLAPAVMPAWWRPFAQVQAVPAPAVPAGGAWMAGVIVRQSPVRLAQVVAALWRRGRTVADGRVAVPVSPPQVLRRGLTMGATASPSPATLPAFWPMVRGPSGGDSNIPLPASWLAYRLPPVGAKIGYELAALAMLQGEEFTLWNGSYGRVGGRQIVAQDGRDRLFSNMTAAKKWREDQFKVLAALVGGLALRAGPEREAWIRLAREEQAAAAQLLMKRTAKVTDIQAREALMQDAAWMIARV